MHKAFNSKQEEDLYYKILFHIRKGECVTIRDVSEYTLQAFYSPLSLATKAVVHSYLGKKEWPFDVNGNISIKNFDSEVSKFLHLSMYDPKKLMEKFEIKPFKASLSWSYKYIKRHGFSFKKAHYERRCALKD